MRTSSFTKYLFEIYNVEKKEPFLLRKALCVNILHDHTSNHKTEDSGGVSNCAVDLRFGGTPFMIEQIGTTGTICRLRTQALRSAATFVFSSVLQQFFAIYALEFLGREGLVVLKFATESGC